MFETIKNLVINLVQLYLIFRVSLFIFRISRGKFRLSEKRPVNRRKSITHKLFVIVTNPIVYKLDDIIKAQKCKRKASLTEKTESDVVGNVIFLKDVAGTKFTK